MYDRVRRLNVKIINHPNKNPKQVKFQKEKADTNLKRDLEYIYNKEKRNHKLRESNNGHTNGK